jgi:exopolyphosphatase/guanosine-5'-triphosphate,3'-diphosphate pyrophosphatase
MQEKTSFERVVRTAEGLHASGRVSDAALERIITAIDEAKATIGIESTVKATATAAFRQAVNTKEALAYIAEKSGIVFEVIDAATEAELAAMAIYEAVQKVKPAETLLIIDIGGASTEIIYQDAAHSDSLSFEIGIVTSANRHGGDEATLIDSLQPMLERIDGFVSKAIQMHGTPSCFAATAGTPTTLAAIKNGMDYATYDKARINGTMLSLRDINDTYSTLLKMDETTRDKLVGSKRGDLVMCGVVIFREIFKTIGYENCMVFDDGLREGIAIAACRELRDT